MYVYTVIVSIFVFCELICYMVGYRHGHIVTHGFDLSLVERVREEYNLQRQSDLTQNPSYRFGALPLQLLQIVLVDAEFFASSHLEEVLLLLPAYVIYFIDEDMMLPLFKSSDRADQNR